MEDNPGRFRRRYFVAMPGVIIATDLSEALSFAGPCEVVVGRSLAEQYPGKYDAIFATLSVVDDESVAKLRAQAVSGSKVVLVEGRTDALAKAEGWSVLQQPFRQEDVHALLLELGLIAG